MNTTDKYLIIPASELTGREARANPNGKRIHNPDYIMPAADKKAEEFGLMLMDAGGNYWSSEDKKRIYFNKAFVNGKVYDLFYDCVSQTWSNLEIGEIIAAQAKSGTKFY